MKKNEIRSNKHIKREAGEAGRSHNQACISSLLSRETLADKQSQEHREGKAKMIQPPWIEITTVLPCGNRCSYFPQSLLQSVYKGTHHKEEVGPCLRAPDFNINVMLPNCDVVLCCNDYGLKHKLGNLLETNYNNLIREQDYELCHYCSDCDKL